MNPLRRWLALFLILTLIPLAAAAGTAESAEAAQTVTHTAEARVYPYLRAFDDEAEITESEMTLYFIDGGDIPYAALSEYMSFFAGLMKDYDEWDDISFEIRRAEGDSGINGFFFSLAESDAALAEYMTVFSNLMKEHGMDGTASGTENTETAGIDSYFVTRPDNGAAMIFLPFADQILFDSYNLFTARPGVTSLVAALDLPEPERVDLAALFEEAEALAQEMQARGEEVPDNFYEDLFNQYDPAAAHTFLINAGGSFDRHGDGTYLNLAQYDIHIYSIDGECYVPFQTMNDLFLNQNYLQYIWTGQNVIGAAYGCGLLDRAFEAGPAEMSLEYGMFNYHELLFLLDTFYGLKPEHSITGFRDMIAHNPQLMNGFMRYDTAGFDESLNLLLGLYLDDLHSGFLQSSWRAGRGEEDDYSELIRFFAGIGHSTSRSIADGYRFGGAREDAYPDGCPAYEEFGDTAFITFDSFHLDVDDLSDYYELGLPQTLEDCGEDTVRLIQYANAQIQRENSPVKNVVIDLSNNGGGSVAAAVAVMSWYMDSAAFSLRDTMTGAMSIMNYDCDLNLNGVADYDDGDTLAGRDYCLYCLVSPVSFSCGNLVPAFFKESHNVTLIGQRTGGGACVVLPCTAASGTLFQISGTKQIALVRNGTFYNVDEGVEPDIPLVHPSSFYDRQGLVDLIHQTK